MLMVYIAAALAGGLLVALSAFGGDHDADGDGDPEHEGELEAGEADAEAGDAELEHGGLEHAHDVGHTAEGHPEGVWLPFFGLRFWTYFAAFFGLTGVLLTILTPLGPALVAALASAVGIGTGTGISYGMRYLRQTQTHSGAGERDLIGTEGRVIVALRGGQPGKVRCHLKGEILDLAAELDGGGTLEPGAPVVVLALNGTRLVVAPASVLEPGAAPAGARARALAAGKRGGNGKTS